MYLDFVIPKGIKELPEDIKQWQLIMAITGGLMGMEMYQKATAIIEANPSFFPGYHKYKSISKEVHDAYAKEIGEIKDKRWAEHNKQMGWEGGGIMDIINKMPKVEFDSSATFDFMKSFDELVERQHKARADLIERMKEDKKVWDKHYKKYGLPYQED